MEKNTRPLATGLVIFGALLRVVQFLNFAPIGALSVFAGARLRGWQAFALPLAVMAVTDTFLGGYSWATPLVYASFLISVWIGTRLRNTENPLVIGAGALAGSIQFFLVTNFASWIGPEHMYPRTLQGLMTAYSMGVPFYWRTLESDLLYTAVFFGLHAWLSRTLSQNERVAVSVA